MIDEETEAAILKIFETWNTEVAAALSANAAVISDITLSRTKAGLKGARRDKFTKAFVDGVTKEITKDYIGGMRKGGSYCVEPVFDVLSDGRIKATTRVRFVPWLSDFTKKQQEDILRMFAEGERAGVYPLDLADEIELYFEGTRHRSKTAARTESQKIAQDARIQGYTKSGVKYLIYITAGDEKVRVTHARRDRKIYPISKAPYIGEYNCRCLLTEADFLVEERGAKVEKDDAEIFTKEELGIGAEV